MILFFHPFSMMCCEHGKNPLSLIAHILLVIGGLNWGLVGLGGFLKTNLNVVNLLLGQWPTVEGSIYLLVGLSAILTLVECMMSKNCDTGMMKK